ncbi:MAG TPA: HAMP domain-containing histidine kinase [Clostridiaceae bacterium]|nr:HAMP domain-containing histidine kinase [Clostridiaceae bacterium]
MNLYKSTFLKTTVFLFITICFFYASFVAISNITADHDIFVSNFESENNNIQIPEIQHDGLFVTKPTKPDINIFRSDLSPVQDDDSTDISESKQANIDFTESGAGSIIWTVITLFFVFSGFVYHCISLGWQKGQENMQFSIIKKWPADLLLVPLGFLIAIFLSIGVYFSRVLAQNNLAVFPRLQIFLSIISTSIFIIIYTYLLFIVIQIKADTLIRSSFIYNAIIFSIRIIKSSVNSLKRLFYYIPILWREILIVIAYISGNILLIKLLHVFFSVFLIIVLLAFNLVFLILSIKFLKNYRKIRDAVLALAQGKLDHHLDETKMTPDFKELTRAVNNLNDGINKAIEEKTKSELFKTELITNVSHDIKTPLTSIIMYTDLLQREKINNQQAEEYVKVLVRQANRLRNLIEDLIEASKISTGNIQVQLMPLDLKQMLQQSYAEYESKLDKIQLKLIMTYPEQPCMILADGKYFWRILDNLLSNVVKYAQPNTRIYLDVLDNLSDIMRIRLRNVSAEPLNITAEQLLERFVQGDSSRSKDGSGIGLSIASSLIAAQNGTIDIQIDGDLFTVELRIPKYLEQN